MILVSQGATGHLIMELGSYDYYRSQVFFTCLLRISLCTSVYASITMFTLVK